MFTTLAPAEETAGPGHQQAVEFKSLDWSCLLDGVRNDRDEANEELYKRVHRGIWVMLARQLQPSQVHDAFHEVFIVAFRAIQRGEVHSPDLFPSFLRTIAQRRIYLCIAENIQSRRQAGETVLPVLSERRISPEVNTYHREKWAIGQRALAALCHQDEEILRRFYLLEQSQQQICQEMHLTATQFRLLKSRAKAKFASHGKRLAAGIRRRQPGSAESNETATIGLAAS